MAQTFTFELVSPERVLLSVEAEQVELPGVDGDMTVMAGHAPVVSTLRPGTIVARAAGNKTAIFVQGGVADIRGSAVVVLAEKAFATDDVDVRQVERGCRKGRRGPPPSGHRDRPDEGHFDGSPKGLTL